MGREGPTQQLALQTRKCHLPGWLLQHPAPTLPASPRAVQNRTQGKGASWAGHLQSASLAIAGHPVCPAWPHFRLPSQLHHFRELHPAQASTSFLLRSAGTARFCRSPDPAKHCKAGAEIPLPISKRSQSALGRPAAAPCRRKPLLQYLSNCRPLVPFWALFSTLSVLFVCLFVFHPKVQNPEDRV